MFAPIMLVVGKFVPLLNNALITSALILAMVLYVQLLSSVSIMLVLTLVAAMFVLQLNYV